MGTRRQVLVGVASMSLLFGACAGGAPPGSTPEASQAPVDGSPAASAPATGAPAEKVKLTLWEGSDNSPEFYENYQKFVVDAFNSQSSTAELVSVVQANIEDATRTALAAGSAEPDIVDTPGPTWSAPMATAGELVALDSYAAKYGWTDRILPWATAVSKVNGSLYSIPSELETLVLYYNKSLFDEHGWTMPSTFGELKTLAAQISDAGVIPFAHANSEFKGADAWYVEEFLNHVAGPDVLKAALTGTGKWTDPKMVQALQELNDMQQAGWFMGGLDRYYTTTFGAADAALASGEAAMEINGTWELDSISASFEAAGNEFAWVPMPSADGTPVLDLSIGSSIGINANSPNPDAAAEFIDWLISPAGQLGLAQAGVNPHPVPADPTAMAKYNPVLAEIMTELAKRSATAGEFGYTDWTFFPADTDAWLQAHIEQMWSGQLTPTAYLTQVQAEWDKDQAANNLLPLP